MKTKKRNTSRRQTQLDRIERKLDELLNRPAVIQTPPGQWIVPHDPPKDDKPPRCWPTDIRGNPVPYAATWEANDSTHVDAAFIRGSKGGAE